MIDILSFLSINMDDVKKYKVHFAIGGVDKSEPLNTLMNGNDSFIEWQNYQTRRNFQLPYVISLVYYKPNHWIFGGVYKTGECTEIKNPDGKSHYLYNCELLNNQTDMIGRAIFYFQKSFRASYPYFEKVYDKISVNSILPERISVGAFPGYLNVKKTYSELHSIMTMSNNDSWKAALSSVKGIYVIADKKTGKLYVGSATGEGGFWQRWADYDNDGHGGDVLLKKIIAINGEDYRQNFQYSILEVCNPSTPDDDVLERESYWKLVLDTAAPHGLNKN